MNKKNTLLLSLCLAVICVSGTAWAQGETGDDTGEKQKDDSQSSSDEPEEGENDESPPPDSEAEEEESEPETDEADEADFEEEEPLEPPSSSKDLDMSALGEVDPEKDLAEGGIVDKDAEAVQAEEEWTKRALDILEIHGYFRVRPEMYHNFNIRGDDALYHRPMVRRTDHNDQQGEDCSESGGGSGCKNSTLAGANLRFRIEPTLNISEEVWIKAQIDFLDNVMLGSTPQWWQNYGLTETTQIETGRVQGWNMGPPDESDMVVVRRAWAEVMTPFGQLRFGRMGDHWGLGMLHNSGNGLNQDFGDSVDRIMFAAKINDWLLAPAFDFPNEGASASDASGRPFDVGQLDDTYQLVGIIAYKHDKEEQLAMLRRGDWIINTGIYFSYRSQVLSFEKPAENADPTADEGDVSEPQFYRRSIWSIVPDWWFHFGYKTFHLEFEAALIYGEVGNPEHDLTDFGTADSITLLQYGGLLQIDYGLLSDQLRIGLEVGFASGDKGVEGLRAPATYDQPNSVNDDTYSAFSFNPAYNTDIILYHHILGSVSQSYYFNAWVRYDFLKTAMGRNLGIQADVLYSRAVFEQSTINGGSGNLGVELAVQAMYVSEDHFHAGIQYGVLFPLAGFKGTPEWDPTDETIPSPYVTDNDLSIPQTIQAILGITY